ncbi:MAG: hypothetical protein C0483_10485 [Pirellula sp.]|nr:hypothetical protein [Pirellula sp.]
MSDAASSPRVLVALIVTALQLEFRSIVAHLTDLKELIDDKGNVFEHGHFSSEGSNWTVVVAECGQGNHAALMMVHAGIDHFAPDVVFFVGVAGSLKTDVALGDVVASSKVILYQSGKAEEKFKPRFQVSNSEHSLVQRARATARNDRWRLRIRGSLAIVNLPPKAVVGAIATGEEVVASAKSTTYEILKDYCSDALAVEMEGYGTHLCAENLGVPAIVVRAMSDNVVNKADCDAAGWQPVAADHAAAFVFEMLANYTIPQRRNATLSVAAAGLATIPQEASRLSIGVVVTDSASPSPQVVAKVVESLSSTLLNWDKLLPSGRWIDRPELRQLLEVLKNEESSTTVLLGAAGAGKSALLAKLGEDLQQSDFRVFAIKADLIDPSVKSPEDLSRFLGLPDKTELAIRQLATESKVVLLVDQLDALANLLDLNSQRLNVVLNLIRDVSGTPNVHIVLSSRSFEYHHDVRLTAIEAEELTLELPQWRHVAEILAEQGVTSDDWPDDFRDSLRNPQHLKFFLQHFKSTAEQHVLESYQQMQDALWQTAQFRPEEIEFLEDAAAAMAFEESLWLPISRFSDRRVILDRVVAAGILRLEGNRFGFQHQTLFEHARARAFTKTGSELADYVLARQDSLFVRPTLWSTLSYLRAVTPSSYAKQFGKLFDAGLRRHLQYLAIDFLGQLADPSAQETTWMNAWIAGRDTRAKALAAIRGNAGWFQILKTSVLPALMRDPDVVWLASRMLHDAWRFDRSDVLRLMEDNWANDDSKDEVIAQTFIGLEDWDERAVSVVGHVLANGKLEGFLPMHLATIVSEHRAELAPRLVASYLSGSLHKLESQIDPSPPELPADANIVDKIVQQATFDPKKRFVELLNSTQRLHSLVEIAEAAPKEYLDHVWPCFVKIVRHTLHESHHILRSFRETSAFADLDSDYATHYPFITSIQQSVIAVATTSPTAFVDFSKKWMDEDVQVVQRLICRGLSAGIEFLSAHALDFVLKDTRRLSLGGHEDRMQDSLALIQKLVPLLATEQTRALEAAILSWSGYHEGFDEDASTRSQRAEWDRESRIRLLSRFPIDRLSAESQALVASEGAESGGHDRPAIRRRGMYSIDSPMSAEQMEAAQDAAIIQLFDVLTDDTGWDHPDRRHEFGGSIQASRELEKLVKKDPERGLTLIRAFRPSEQERPTGTIIRALSSTDMSSTQLFELILELDERGFGSDLYRDDVAQALHIRAEKDNGLPDDICALLNKWLAEASFHADDSESYGTKQESERPRSLLWDGGGGYTLPHGTYWMLRALTYGFLRHDVPKYDEWLTTLESHVERPENSRVWKAMTEELRFLVHCDQTRVSTFVNRLAERFPDVIASQFGLLLLARIRISIEPTLLKQLIESIRDSSWREGPQAYGEIIGFLNLFEDKHSWTDDIVASVASSSFDDSSNHDAAMGLAYAAANLWYDTNSRAVATQILTTLAPKATEEIGEAIMSAFLRSDTLIADRNTRNVLSAIIENPSLLLASSTSYLIEKLEDLITVERELVYGVCKALLTEVGSTAERRNDSIAMSAPHLTNIAITLQRTGDTYRNKGLELFEQLLEFGVADAYSLLEELDHRMRGVPKRTIRRRRRRAS